MLHQLMKLVLEISLGVGMLLDEVDELL